MVNVTDKDLISKLLPFKLLAIYLSTFLSLQDKISMEEFLSYPLVVIQLSLCHVDGLKQTTRKVELLYKLESRIPNEMPQY